MIRDVAMRSIVTLPLDPHEPYQLGGRELIEYVSSGMAGKLRVLLDPEGLVLRLARGTVEYGVGLDADYREQILVQQRQEYNRLLRYLTVLDSMLPGVVQRIVPIAVSYWPSEDWPQEVARAVQRFVKITIGSIILDLVEYLQVAIVDKLQSVAIDNCRSAIAGVNILRKSTSKFHGKADTLWARDILPGQEWLDLGFRGDDIRDVHVFLPADHFGEMSTDFLMSGSSPATEVTTADWLTICVPQVAARVIPAEASSVPDVLDSVGWSISDYRHSGRH